jgi:N4-gp56 family major capsid protein
VKESMYSKTVRLAVTVLAYLWQPFVILLAAQAQMASTMGYQFNAGYSPASMSTSNLPQSQAIFFDKNFVHNLKANTTFLRVAERRELPANSGNSLVLYMYEPLGAVMTQAAEGTVGSGRTIAVLSNRTYIGQYADYINFSDLSLETAIDPTLENVSREEAYSLGQTLSYIVRNTLDAANAVDSSVLNQLATNLVFGKSNITTMVASLQGRNVKPFTAGKYCGVVHPFCVGDALNDTSNNSLTDVLKHTREGQMRLEELPGDGDEVQIFDWAGCLFFSSTLVTQTTNYLSSGKTALRTYLVGQDGVIAISLGKTEGTAIGDGDWRNLKCWIRKLDEPSVSDPSRLIGGFTSYNTKFSATLPPDTTMRVREVDALSLIS